MPKLFSQTVDLSNDLPAHGNRLIDVWIGIALAGCGGLLILLAALGRRQRRWGVAVSLLGAIALGLVIYASTGSRLIIESASGVAGAVSAEAGIGMICAGLASMSAIGAGIVISSVGAASTSVSPVARPARR